MRQLFGFLFILNIITFSLHAQEKTPDIQKILDNIFSTQELPLNYDEIYDNLLIKLQDPIDLNKATQEDLRSIYILNEEQIQNLERYREENGNLISLYELQSIPHFDATTIQQLMPFVTLSESVFTKTKLKPTIKSTNSFFMLRYEQTLEKVKGFSNVPDSIQKFQGSPEKIYMRFRSAISKKYSYGFTLEKDSGEPFRWTHEQPGFDFYSFHMQLQNKGLLKNFIIGDYLIQAGQGLVLGAGFSIGKGGETITTVRKANLGAIPYTSSNENSAWRGVSSTLTLHKKISISTHFSYNKKDASIASDSLENYFISSLSTTGLHRNTSEINRRKTIEEINYGGVLDFHSEKIQAGLIWNTTQLTHPIIPLKRTYNTFAFKGDINSNTSLFYNYTLHNFLLFGELANNWQGGHAWTLGLTGSLSPKFDITLLYRNYQKDYHAFYANGFGENSLTQNESGLYQGFKYKVNRVIQINGYIDMFKFPWLQYRSYSPAEGHEWMLRINIAPSRNTSVYLQVREESKQRNNTTENSLLYSTLQAAKKYYLANINIDASENFRLKTRLQFSNFKFGKTKSQGMLIAQDMRWKIGSLTINARYSLFDTDDYDTRQYIYENDVWLSFSIPSYSGKGIRNCILLDYRLTSWASVSMRYAHTRYANQDTIGSGLNTINGNTKNDIKIQVLFRF